jgi:hypothetical protein
MARDEMLLASCYIAYFAQSVFGHLDSGNGLNELYCISSALGL